MYRVVRWLAVAGLLGALGCLFALIFLWIGDDHMIPCNASRGLDGLFRDQFGHVDGPEGGGGCIVPTAASWAMAMAGALTPTVIFVVAQPAQVAGHGI